MKLVKTYATALFEEACAIGKAAEVLAEIRVIGRAINGKPEFRRLFISPIVSREEKLQLVNALTEKLIIENIVRQFLLLLINNSRINILKEIVALYQTLLNDSKSIRNIEITSSAPLSLMEKKELRKYLENWFRQRVSISYSQDPAIIRGIVIKYGSRLIDCSLAGALSRVEKTLQDARISLS